MCICWVISIVSDGLPLIVHCSYLACECGLSSNATDLAAFVHVHSALFFVVKAISPFYG